MRIFPGTPVVVKAVKEDFKKCCVLVPLPSDLASKVIDWGRKNIDDADLYVEPGTHKDGRILDTHTTVKWGLASETDLTSVKEIARRTAPFTVRLGHVSLFKHGTTNDVVIVTVHSQGMHDLHDALSKIPRAEESHFEYSPHVTIAYVLPDVANHLKGNDEFIGYSFTVDEVCFAKKNGKRVYVKLKGKGVEKSLSLIRDAVLKAVKTPDRLKGGKGDHAADKDFDATQLAAGIKVEMEHTDDKALAKEIAKDHLTEDPSYYRKLKRMEAGGVKKAVGDPRARHKYRSRKPKAGGGWEYDYRSWTELSTTARLRYIRAREKEKEYAAAWYALSVPDRFGEKGNLIRARWKAAGRVADRWSHRHDWQIRPMIAGTKNAIRDAVLGAQKS